MQNKYLVGSLVTLAVIGVLGAVGGGVWWWHGHHKAQTVSYGAASINEDSTVPVNSGGTSGEPSLNVASGGSLGQLNGSQNSSGNATGQGGSNTNKGSSSSSGGSIDPSTFSQYDKYKNDKSALFGDVQKGTGTALTAGHQAAVYYKGWLTDGTLFDQSRAGSDGKLQPFTFRVGAHQVIPGWEEGLVGMKVGGTRLLVVPPAVGYGAQGQGSIPPNSVLVFEVQLVGVQ